MFQTFFQRVKVLSLHPQKKQHGFEMRNCWIAKRWKVNIV